MQPVCIRIVIATNLTNCITACVDISALVDTFYVAFCCSMRERYADTVSFLHLNTKTCLKLRKSWGNVDCWVAVVSSVKN